VKVLEALSLSTSGKMAWGEYWAVTGRWPTRPAADDGSATPLAPPRGAIPLPYAGDFLEPVRIEAGDGAFSFLFKAREDTKILDVVLHHGDDVLRGYSIGIRPAFAPAENPTATVWLCGYAAPPRGFVAPMPTPTTAPAEWLPSPCRAPRRAE